MVELFTFKDRFDAVSLVVSECGVLNYRYRTICCGLCVLDNYDCNSMHKIDIKQYCMTRIW